MSNNIPEILIKAQEFQKAGDYALSRKLYKNFFYNSPNHVLRFKALFEVADNYYYARDYDSALQYYRKFISYCKNQNKITSEEQNWICAYIKLAYSRINYINKCRG